jgi:hypothetical protein
MRVTRGGEAFDEAFARLSAIEVQTKEDCLNLQGARAVHV